MPYRTLASLIVALAASSVLSSAAAQPAAVEVSLVSVTPGLPPATATGVSAPRRSRSLRMSSTSHLKAR